jgi:hypothetical protein
MMKKSCPGDEMFADYLEGRLPDGERYKIEEHLSDCEICLQEFIVGKGVIRGGDSHESNSVPSRVTQAAVRLVNNQVLISPGSLMERFKRSIKGLYLRLSGLFSPTPWIQWRLAPIRGSKRVVSKDLIHLRKAFKEIDTEIEIEKTSESKAHIRVKLPKSNTHRKGIRVTLKRGEREISSYLLDGGGSVLFEDIPFGHYGLTFSRDGVKLGTYLFEIKETLYGRR